MITQQPESILTLIRESFNLTCIANGTAPLNFQWSKDGIDISSFTEVMLDIVSFQSILSLTGSLTDAGRYICNVSNEFGFEVSNEAVVTILCKCT